jgi:uncharacterized integral membrane protein
MTDENRDGREAPRVTTAATGPSAALIIFGIVVVLLIIFFLQNGERTSIDFLFFEKRTTIRWSLVVAAALGVVADRIAGIWWRRRKRRNDER